MHISGKFWSSRFGRIFVDWVSFTSFFWNHHQLEAMVWDQQTDNIFFWDIREQPQAIQFIEAIFFLLRVGGVSILASSFSTENRMARFS